ncbi:hypothetical protein CEXT_556011 [Caerostris extrusa]|uniref:Transposase n=1 Tax=Caerostris extrusa TaxID=172846 RepID=A0AAV4TBK4_CAEEX|nr:hypothetical protein CEXT_556011 [Caerostris extrusa]
MATVKRSLTAKFLELKNFPDTESKRSPRVGVRIFIPDSCLSCAVCGEQDFDGGAKAPEFIIRRRQTATYGGKSGWPIFRALFLRRGNHQVHVDGRVNRICMWEQSHCETVD